MCFGSCGKISNPRAIGGRSLDARESLRERVGKQWKNLLRTHLERKRVRSMVILKALLILGGHYKDSMVILKVKSILERHIYII
jgi:hypothetical protein